MLKATSRAIPLQDAALSTKSQNTSTVYLSRLASPSLQSFLQGNSFRLESIDVPVVYPEISTHADILLCQLGLWEKAQIFHGDPEKLARNYPGNISSTISSTRIRIFWQLQKRKLQPNIQA